MLKKNHTIDAWNKPKALFVHKKCIVELVCIFCTQTRHSFISIANNALRPVNDCVSLLLQISFEGGPREPTIGQLEADFTWLHSGRLVELLQMMK